eukprot:TRINITY_DN45201_c0_g1_i1.p1 TRINITY_DN45201_c0_g1~~TRINITY_DN45201_c0_g1_i1.p1  ORF type:complete len:121 (+),score=9.05 TRINITY_DN45201_c0_g1_i1:30-392(+)
MLSAMSMSMSAVIAVPAVLTLLLAIGISRYFFGQGDHKTERTSRICRKLQEDLTFCLSPSGDFEDRVSEALERMVDAREQTTYDLNSLFLVCQHGSGRSLPPIAISNIARYLDGGWNSKG